MISYSDEICEFENTCDLRSLVA